MGNLEALIVYNPVASQAPLGREKIAAVQESLARQHVGARIFETASPDNRRNMSDIADEIRDGDIVISVGGDKTAGTVVGSMFASERSDISFANLAAGGVSDGARSMLADISRDVKVFEEGSSQTMYAIKNRVSHEDRPDDATEEYGLSYIGFGACGQVTRTVKRPFVRKLRGQEGRIGQILRRTTDISIAVHHALWLPSLVEYEIDDQLHKAHEVMYINGDSLSGLVRTRQSLQQEQLLRAHLPKGVMAYPKAIGSIFVRSARRQVALGEVVKQETITMRSDVLGQIDGDTTDWPSGTRLNVSLVPFQGWTTLDALGRAAYKHSL